MKADYNLTALSMREMDWLLNQNISADDAYRYINSGLQIRAFNEILSRYYSGDLKKQLIKGLCRIEDKLPEDSIARKVRDWLNGKYQPTERIDLIKICFALNFTESKANAFLTMTADGGFHLRNPEELAFAYCLRAGKNYNDAIALTAGLEPLPVNEGKNFVMTKTVAVAFQDVFDDESFAKFYKEQFDNLGRLHNTAYSRFMFFLDTLIKPSTALYTKSDNAYSVDEVVETYLRMNLPFNKRTAKMTLLQKTIRKYWPNATSVIKMRNRSEDVTRRVLLLLYLVTEGAGLHDDYDEDVTPRELFDEQYWRINSMLHDCGMSRLDPRNIFDWLVLYCLKTSEDEAMSERMQSVLNLVFNTETS